MKSMRHELVALLLLAICSCDKLTAYSPYDANTEHRDLNTQNIAEIQNMQQPADSMVFIAISDTHTQYSDLSAAISVINKMNGISFVVVCGDVTNLGLHKEFDDYYHIISRLNVPFITIIGNHDYLSNGKLIFNKMFGPTNFHFDIGNYRMVMFDNIVWENDNRRPDFDWLSEILDVPEEVVCLVGCHIHPWDPQLGNGYASEMQDIVEKSAVNLTIFGHGHGNRVEEVNNKKYLMIPDIGLRNMVRISLQDKTATYKILNF